MEARLLCPWDFPEKNTGVDCLFLLQGVFPTQGSDAGLLHCRQILYHWATRDALGEEGEERTVWCLSIPPSTPPWNDFPTRHRIWDVEIGWLGPWARGTHLEKTWTAPFTLGSPGPATNSHLTRLPWGSKTCIQSHASGWELAGDRDTMTIHFYPCSP